VFGRQENEAAEVTKAIPVQNRVRRVLPIAVGCIAGLTACRKPANSEDQLPEVKTPVGIHVACEPVRPVPPVIPCDIVSGCGFRQIECDKVQTLVVRVNERGVVTAASVAGERSPKAEDCAREQLARWEFQPARECTGEPLPGEFRVECAVICDAAW
jgi:hypothetical protein